TGAAPLPPQGRASAAGALSSRARRARAVRRAAPAEPRRGVPPPAARRPARDGPATARLPPRRREQLPAGGGLKPMTAQVGATTLRGMRLAIREMTAADAAGVARVRAQDWRHGYRGLVPPETLEGRSATRFAARLRRQLSDRRHGHRHLVAEATSPGVPAG